MSESPDFPKENRKEPFDFKKEIARGLIFGTAFFGISAVLGRFFKRDKD